MKPQLVVMMGKTGCDVGTAKIEDDKFFFKRIGGLPWEWSPAFVNVKDMPFQERNFGGLKNTKVRIYACDLTGEQFLPMINPMDKATIEGLKVQVEALEHENENLKTLLFASHNKDLNKRLTKDQMDFYNQVRGFNNFGGLGALPSPGMGGGGMGDAPTIDIY